MPSNHLILRRPLLLPPSIFPSISVFSNKSALCIRWPKYWSFSFNINASNKYSGLISFRMDWLDLLAVQGTLKSAHTLMLSETPPLNHCYKPFIIPLVWNTVFQGRRLLRPPLPGKAIKLSFSTSPKISEIWSSTGLEKPSFWHWYHLLVKS